LSFCCWRIIQSSREQQQQQQKTKRCALMFCIPDVRGSWLYYVAISCCKGEKEDRNPL
jgi:hypothetical protein